jgi:hypothetical protein
VISSKVELYFMNTPIATGCAACFPPYLGVGPYDMSSAHSYSIEFVLCILVRRHRIKALKQITCLVFAAISACDEVLAFAALPDRAFRAPDEMTRIATAASAIYVLWFQALCYSNLCQDLSIEVRPFFGSLLPQFMIVIGCGNEGRALSAIKSTIR